MCLCFFNEAIHDAFFTGFFKSDVQFVSVDMDDLSVSEFFVEDAIAAGKNIA